MIKIRNNSRHYQRGYLPLYNEVPCGCCPECIGTLQRDFFLRIYYECLYTEKYGQTFVMTFTYNDDCVPSFNWTSQDIENCNTWLNGAICSDDYEYNKAIKDFEDCYGGIFGFLPTVGESLCFNRKDLSKFMKSLRQLLHQNNIYTYEQQKVRPIKYYFASEYGGTFHRPHYHALLFVPFEITQEKWLALCNQAWSSQIDISSLPESMVKSLPQLAKGQYMNLDLTGKRWFNYHYYRTLTGRYILKLQRGNVEYSKKNPAVAIAGKGLQYLVKYIRKTDEFTSRPQFQEIRSYLKCFMSPTACREFGLPALADSVEKLKNLQPFVHTSANLGAYIVNVLEKQFGNGLAEHIGTKCLEVRGSTELYKVPNYIINRIMYRRDLYDNTLRVLTETGVKCMFYRYLDKIDFLQKSYRDTVALARHLDKSVLDDVFKQFKGMSQEEWFNFGSHSLFGDMYHNLAIYNLSYRNVVTQDYENFTDITPLVDTSLDAFMSRFALPLDADLSPKCMYLRAFQMEEHNSFNFAPCFSGFEIWLIIWQNLNRILRQKKVQDKWKNEQRDYELKKFYIDISYGE